MPVLFALLALTALRLVVAALVPLSPDEAYYWMWSRHLAGGYFDHPPMVSVWIRAGTFLCGDTPLGVRLLAPLSTALGSVILARAAVRLTGDTARGVMAAVLFNATIAFGIGAVSMTPDTPLMFFWILGLAALARLVGGGHGAWWLAFGAGAGLALASKFTAVFLGAGVALWLVVTPTARAWLRGPWPYLSGLIALACFAPVLLWNAEHAWVGFSRQGGRLSGFRPDHAFYFLTEFIFGQVGMMSPLVFFLSCVGVVVAARGATRTRDPATWLLLILTLLPLPVFLQHTLADRVQANWPAIVYPSAVILATLAWPRLHRPAAALGLGLTLAIYVHAAWAILPIPEKFDPSMKRLAGWAELAREADAARRAAGLGYIAADNYSLAAILAWYLPVDVPVIGAQARFASFDLPRPDLTGQAGLLVRSGRLADNADTRLWSTIERIGMRPRGRNGISAEDFYLYRVLPVDGTDPRRVRLPSPGAQTQP